MLWVLLCVLGLTAETWVIIVLGRQVTRRYEAEVEPDPTWPGTAALVRPRSEGGPHRTAGTGPRAVGTSRR